MGIALMLDQRPFAYPHIRLPQVHSGLPGQDDKALAGPVKELGIGREHHVLGLNRGIDDDPACVLGFHRPGLDRHTQAFLQQGRNPLLAHALAPAGH